MRKRYADHTREFMRSRPQMESPDVIKRLAKEKISVVSAIARSKLLNNEPLDYSDLSGVVAAEFALLEMKPDHRTKLGLESKETGEIEWIKRLLGRADLEPQSMAVDEVELLKIICDNLYRTFATNIDLDKGDYQYLINYPKFG